MRVACRLLCLFICLSGCYSRNYDGDQRYEVSGKITCDGEPIDLGSISFIPQDGDKQRVSGGVVADGLYSVPEAEGPNAGKYRIEIHWAKKTGKQHFESDLQMMVDNRKEALPARYHQNSELTADVSAKQTVFDFELKSK